MTDVAKKSVALLALAFAAFNIVTQPEGAADAVKGAIGAVLGAFDAIIRFFNALVA